MFTCKFDVVSHYSPLYTDAAEVSMNADVKAVTMQSEDIHIQEGTSIRDFAAFYDKPFTMRVEITRTYTDGHIQYHIYDHESTSSDMDICKFESSTMKAYFDGTVVRLYFKKQHNPYIFIHDFESFVKILTYQGVCMEVDYDRLFVYMGKRHYFGIGGKIIILSHEDRRGILRMIFGR